MGSGISPLQKAASEPKGTQQAGESPARELGSGSAGERRLVLLFLCLLLRVRSVGRGWVALLLPNVHRASFSQCLPREKDR